MPMIEKILFTLLLLVFLATGVVMFMHKSGLINVGTIEISETVGNDAQEPTTEDDSGSRGETLEDGSTTRIHSGINTEALEVIPNNMLNAELSTDPKYWGSESDMLPKFAETLNAIFAGDEQVLRDTFSEQARCGTNDYRNIEDVERGMAKIQESAAERMSRRGDGNPNPQRMERWMGGMELRALEQVENCMWRHQTAAQKLRADVAAQANAGDVMARFVYATMLAPSSYEENYPEEHATWASAALRFTEQNVMEGWSLGFEAMELSANWGLFTPASLAMSQAWGIVLTTCPIAGPAPIDSDWNRRFRGMMDFSTSAPIHAARLIEQHCPGSIANFTPPDITPVQHRDR